MLCSIGAVTSCQTQGALLVVSGKTLSVPNDVQDAEMYIQFVLIETEASKIPLAHARRETWGIWAGWMRR